MTNSNMLKYLGLTFDRAFNYNETFAKDQRQGNEKWREWRNRLSCMEARRRRRGVASVAN